MNIVIGQHCIIFDSRIEKCSDGTKEPRTVRKMAKITQQDLFGEERS